MIKGFYSEAQANEKIITLIHQAREEHGVPEGTRAEVVCQMLGLRVCHQPQLGRDGLLHERHIFVNPTVSAERAEFTIYHEITHYLLDEDGELIEFLTNALRNDEAAYNSQLERYCNAGAAEFLIPRHQVRAYINEYGFSVQLIERIAADHNASVLASSIQLGLYAPEDCYVIVCNYGNHHKSIGTGATLYVDQATIRRGMKYPLARYSPIPRDHFFWDVYKSKHPMTQRSSFIEFHKSQKRIPIVFGEAQPLRDRVLGILYTDRRPQAKDSGQMSLF